MNDFRPQDLRLSDTERDDAVRALGEHMSTGRLDMDEYGERSAKVTAARTRGDLRELFEDLPEPHPTFGAAQTPAPAAPGRQEPSARQAPAPQRFSIALLPLAGIVGVVLFFTIGGWWWFLLPALICWLGGSFSGGGCGSREGRHDHMQRRMAHLDRNRERRMAHLDRRMRRMQDGRPW